MGLKQLRVGRWGTRLVTSLALVAALAVSVGTTLVQTRSPAPEPSPAPTIASFSQAEFPAQVHEVVVLIRKGGPFPHDKDGTVFGNRERLLPAKTRGYYREYTVPTPGLGHRGARRIVCGGAQPREPEACFYTADHYASFQVLAM